LIRVPRHFGLEPGKTVAAPVGLEDIMPTCLEMAEVAIPPGVEGRSLLPLMRSGGEGTPWREYIHIEHAPMHHTLTDGKEKYIWFAEDGREQFFRLTEDPTECHDLAPLPKEAGRISYWRGRLIGELKDRPEGFTDGTRLIAGRPYHAVLQQGKG
jgi:arylsulfatase A-like enzyme